MVTCIYCTQNIAHALTDGADMCPEGREALLKHVSSRLAQKSAYIYAISAYIYVIYTYTAYRTYIIQVTLVITELVIPFVAYRKPKRPKTEQIRQLTGGIIGYGVRYPVCGSAKMVWHARQNHSPSVVTSPDRLS